MGSVGEGAEWVTSLKPGTKNLGFVSLFKTILPREISNDAESLARFRREVRVGLQANHPNICRIFQIDHARHASRMGAAPRPNASTSSPWSFLRGRLSP